MPIGETWLLSPGSAMHLNSPWLVAATAGQPARHPRVSQACHLRSTGQEVAGPARVTPNGPARLRHPPEPGQFWWIKRIG